MATETTVYFEGEVTVLGVTGQVRINAGSADEIVNQMSRLTSEAKPKSKPKGKAKAEPEKEAEPEATVDPMLEQKAQAKTDPEPTKTAPATQPATDTAQADTATSSAKGTDTPEIGSKDLLDAAKALLAIGPEGEKALGEILKKHGATRVSTAPKEKYAALHADLVAAVEGDAEEGGLL